MKIAAKSRDDDHQRGQPVATRISQPASVHALADNRPSTTAQRKLVDSIQHPVDRLHHSARMVAQRAKFEAAFGPAIQRQPVEEEKLQMRKAPGRSPVGQFKGAEDEDLQKKASPAAAQLQDGSPQPQNNTGLPDGLKSGIESLSGISLDNVNVHYKSAQPAQIGALAYAQGSDIHVAPGQERHLPHEAWHLVQQAQGRVMPTTQMKDGTSINDDQGLEHEADIMGARALQSKK